MCTCPGFQFSVEYGEKFKLFILLLRGVDLRTILGIGLDLDSWVVSRSRSRSVLYLYKQWHAILTNIF